MNPLRYLTLASLAVATCLILAACAQRASVVPTAPSGDAAPLLVPPDCKGQKTTKKYAQYRASLQASGGAFCIPAYGGFGGKLEYPNAKFNQSSVGLGLTSHDENYDHQPNLGSGRPIFYIEFSLSGPVSFGNKLKSGGGLTGAKIESGKPYTIYGRAKAFGQTINLGPCYTTATGGKYGGVIGELGSLIKGEDVPSAAIGVIEIYSGEATTTGC